MFLILNRLRGTIGAYSKVIGLLLALIIEMVYHNPYVSVAVGLGYILGETAYGWGEMIGDITDDGSDDEGRSSEKLIIRGFVWSAPTLIPLYFVGFSPSFILVSVAFLSFGFPLASKLGYWSSTKFIFVREGFSVKGGWEHQEIWTGLMQDIVFIGGICYVVANGYI